MKSLAFIHNPKLATEVFGNSRQDVDGPSAPIGREELSDLDAYLRSIEGGRPVVAKIAFDGEWV